MKKLNSQWYVILCLIVLITNFCWAGFVVPPNLPKSWDASIYVDGKSPIAIATAPDPGTVIIWAEEDPSDYHNYKIYGTLWNGTKTYIGTIHPDDMNAAECPISGACGRIRIPEVDITHQAVFDGTRNCFYVAIMVYDMCTLCLDQDNATRVETWIVVYKVWNNSGQLDSDFIGRFGIDFETPAMIREVEACVPHSALGSTRIYDLAIEKAVCQGDTYVYLYYIFADYIEQVEYYGNPVFFVYFRSIDPECSTISGDSSIYSWDEDIDHGVDTTDHCISATFDDYSDRIWLICNHSNEIGDPWYATVAKMNENGTLSPTKFFCCKSNAIASRISADNNASSSRVGICWKDNTDMKIKTALVTDSGVGATATVSGSGIGNHPDISYIDNSYFAVVYDDGGRIRITRWLSGTPDPIETGVEIAKSWIVTGLNLTVDNRFPRIATYPGSGTGQFYMVWSGIDPTSSGKIIGKHSGNYPFQQKWYYCPLGWQITGAGTYFFSKTDYIEASDNFGGGSKQCEMEFVTTGFPTGDQVYHSEIRAYLSFNDLKDKYAHMNLLYNPNIFGVGDDLIDLADKDDGTGWTPWRDISNYYNYFNKRPGGYDYFYITLNDYSNPTFAKCIITISSNRPQLHLWCIDWEP